MKILLYTRPLAPPWDEASKNLAYELSQNVEGDFEFEVLTTQEFAKEIKKKEEKKEGYLAEAKPEPIYSSTKFGAWSKLRLLMRLYRFKLNADAIHFLFTPRSLTSFMIKLRLSFSKAKTIQTVAALPSVESRQCLNSTCGNNKKLRKVFFTDKVITQSNHTEEKLNKVGIENTATIYPGIDLEEYSPTAKDEQLIQELGFSSEDFLLQYTGEYTKMNEKTVDDVIDAMEILWKKDLKYKLIMTVRIKSPEDKKKKEAVIERLKKSGYDKQVVFLDYFNDIARLFNTTDLNIFPARKMEGKFDIPYAIVEPMACGRAVVISDLPVLKEFVRDGENGVIVPKADPETLAKTIEYLKNNPVTLDRIGSNARKFAQENFDIKKTAKEYAEVYESL